MAMKLIFDSTRLLEQILLNESQEDGLNILCRVDLNDIPYNSPVHVLSKSCSFKFQTCVSQTDMDTLSLSISSFSGKITSDLNWPVVVKWKVTVINESTEKCIDLNTVITTFIKPNSEISEKPVIQNVTIHLSEIEDFITDNSILLRWNVKLSTEHETMLLDREPTQTWDKVKIMEHIEAVLDLAHNISAKINSDKCREQLEQLKLAVSQSSIDDETVVHWDSRIDEADERINKLATNFSGVTQKLTEFMTDWRDAVSYVQMLASNSDEPGSLTQTGETSIDQLGSSIDAHEGSTTARSLNFLLIGDSETGKSATGNSILFRRAFKTGKDNSKGAQVQHAQIVLSNLNIMVTVVEVSKQFPLKNEPTPFELCPDGFDAILCIQNYRKVKYGDTFYVFYYPDEVSIDNGALKCYAIPVLTGGDSFVIDHPNTTFPEFLRTIFKDAELEKDIPKRAVLFDNTTTSQEKKNLQMKDLVEKVDSLPKDRARFTEEMCMESVMNILVSKVKNLHILKDWETLHKIERRFSSLPKLHRKTDWRKIMNCIYNIPINLRVIKKRFGSIHKTDELTRDVIVEDVFKVLLFGKPNESVDTVKGQAETAGISCQYRHLELLTDVKEISYFTAILLVVSCVKLSAEDKEIFNKVCEKYSPEICQKGILVVIDGSQVDLHEDNHKFLDWCNQENEFFKIMLTACAGRAVVYDHETSDVVLRFEQEANLVKMLHSLSTLSNPPSESDTKLLKLKGTSYFKMHDDIEAAYLLRKIKDTLDLY